MFIGALITGIVAGHSCEGFSVWSVLAALIALPFGCIFGAILLGPFFYVVASKINGSPFREGDLVHVLCGPYRDRVGLVYELWPSRKQLRVQVGDQAKEGVTDVFSYHEICREWKAREATSRG